MRPSSIISTIGSRRLGVAQAQKVAWTVRTSSTWTREATRTSGSVTSMVLPATSVTAIVSSSPAPSTSSSKAPASSAVAN